MIPPDQSFDVEICVCTFRRDQITKTLTSLNRMAIPTGVQLSVLVVDNDNTASAYARVTDVANASKIDIRYVHCPAANISIARNGALDHSKARFLGFVDDDETVEQDWLIQILRTLRKTGADVVLGPVEAVYGDFAPVWMKQLKIHEARPVWVDGEIRTGYTCNALIDRESDAVANIRFDLDLGVSGGEDTRFFAEVHKRGGKIAFSELAVVYEEVPMARTRFEWLLRRRFRMGQTHGRLLADGVLKKPRIGALPSVVVKVAYCASVAMLNMPCTRRRNAAILRGSLHFGTLMGLIGMRELTQYGSGYAESRR